jgi:hypothetical protein
MFVLQSILCDEFVFNVELRSKYVSELATSALKTVVQLKSSVCHM